MHQDNYEIAKQRAREYFLTMSQQDIHRRPFLTASGDYFYTVMLNQPCRVDRCSGLVELQKKDGNWREGDFNVALTVYDLLCYSKPDAHPSAEYVSISQINPVFTASDNGSFYTRLAKAIDKNPSLFTQICSHLGGVPAKAPGDLAFLLPLTDFLSVVLQFWEADEEFPATISVLVDSSILDFMHFETVWYALGHLTGKIMSLMEPASA
ncbi:MAG: DUF3786 domain-containing protein [Oscillospiraceae bacterium]|nr:DUF3786 domain-containing protein [Oscillospiraceae bacterium]